MFLEQMGCCGSFSNIKDINNVDFIVFTWKLIPQEPSDVYQK